MNNVEERQRQRTGVFFNVQFSFDRRKGTDGGLTSAAWAACAASLAISATDESAAKGSCSGNGPETW